MNTNFKNDFVNTINIMCGINGLMSPKEKRETINVLTDNLYHRGPDYGNSIICDSNMALGHRRLAIIDTTSKGNQPMTYQNKTIIYNGEIYNFKEIRRDLESKGYKFNSNTDTEVILKGYNEYGKDITKKLNGMFAFGIYDSNKKELFLARDRFGIKPLYFAYNKYSEFVFSSEVESIIKANIIPKTINWEKVYNEFFCGSQFQIRGDTLIDGVKELTPGYHMTIDLKNNIKKEKYWDYPDEEDVLERKITNQIKELIEDSIKLRLMSDVQIGAFLSGGLDSSYINAIAKKHSDIHSLTIDYKSGIDPNTGKPSLDLYYSKLLARKLKLKHHIIPGDKSKSTIKDIDSIIDMATFSDDPRYISIYNNYRYAKELGLKVILNGQGADELMGGYNNFKGITNIFDIQHTIKTFPIFTEIYNYHDNILNQEIIKYREQSLKKLIDFSRTNGVKQNRISLLKTFLGRILQMEDNLSMSLGIETRVPFLDHRLVELALKIPYKMHIMNNGEGKKIIRQAAKGVLPSKIVNRPKQAFPGKGNKLRNELYIFFNDNYDEMIKSDLLNHLFNKKAFKKEHLKKLTDFALFKILSMWRWEYKLKC